MTAPPTRRRRVLHRSVLLGLLSLCSGAGAEVALTNTFTPATTQVGGTTTYALTVSSTEVVALTGTRLTHTLTGVSSIADSTATSTCGGTVVSSGNVLTWSGATVAAAPTSGATTCKVTVQVKVGATPNSYVTTIPAESLGNDQGRTNRYAASASFNSTPLHNYQVRVRTTDPQTPPNTYWYFAKGWPTTTAAVELTNPNHTLLESTGNTLRVPDTFSDPVISGDGCAADFSLPNSDYGRVYTVNDLRVPGAGTCLVTFTVRSTPPAYGSSLSATDPDADALNAGVDRNTFTTLAFRTGTVTQDTSLNDTALSPTNPYPYHSTALAVVLGFNGSKGASLSSSSDQAITMRVELKNRTLQPHAFSFTDPLGDFFDLRDGTVTLADGRDVGANCRVDGVRLNSAPNAAVFDDVTVPARSVCYYDLTFKLPKGALSGPYVNEIRSSMVTTDLFPASAAENTVATQAQLNVQVDGEVRKIAGASGQFGLGYYRLDFTNPTSTAMTGLAFTDTWNHALTTDLSRSYSTCGGTLTAPADSRGLVFAGGTLAGGASCKVVIAIDPRTLAPYASYENSLPNITTTSGHTLVAKGGTVSLSPAPNYLVNDYLAGSTPTSVPTGQPVHIRARYDNQAYKTLTDKLFTLTLTPGETLTGDLTVSCDWHDPVQIPAGAMTRSGDTYSFRATIPAATPPSTPIDQNYPPSMSCVFSVPVTKLTPGFANHTYNAPQDTDGANPEIGTTVLYSTSFTWVTDAQYTINTSFSPQTVYAGQTTQLTVSAPVPANSTATQSQASRTRFRIVDRLPTGLEVSPVFLANAFSTRQEANGWVAMFAPYSGTPTDTTLSSVCDADRTCTSNGLLIAPDRKTVIVYTTPSSPAIPMTLLVTRFGDLINTVAAQDTAPVPSTTSAAIIGDTSASLKVLPSIVATASFTPGRIVTGRQTTLGIRLINANPVEDTLTVINPLPANVTLEQPLTVSGCPGTPTASYDAGSRQLTIRGVTLGSNEECTAQIAMTGTTGGSPVTVTNTIPRGYVSGPASNTGNQVEASARLTIDPIPFCVATPNGQPTAQSLMLTTPGQGNVSMLYTNNGAQALGANNLTWAATLPDSYGATYRFDGAAGAQTPQEAWQNRVDQQGALSVGATTRLTVTYTSPKGQTRGAQAQGRVMVTPEGEACAGIQNTQTLQVVQAEPGITKTQAICRPSAGGPSCTPETGEPLPVARCEVLRYTLTAVNNGDAPLLRPLLRDALDTSLVLQAAVARSSLNTPMLYSVNGAAFGALPADLAAIRELRAAPDSNKDGQIDANDAQQPGEVLTLVLDTVLKDPCPASR